MAEDLSEQEEANKGYDWEDMGTSSASCGCFRGILCSSWRRCGGYELYRKEEEEEEEGGGGGVKEKWWQKKMKKMKVLSELLGGPKWKNFLRYRFRFRMNKKMRRMLFQYDPRSYALNFDDGTENKDDDAAFDFCARFANPIKNNIACHDTKHTGFGFDSSVIIFP